MSAAENIDLSPRLDVTAERRPLAAALRELKRLAAGRSVMPVLSHVLLEADGTTLHLAATDLAVSLRRELPAKGAAGALCLPAEALARVAAGAGGVRLAAGAGSTGVLERGPARFELSSYDPDDFPTIPRTGGLEAVALPAEALARVLELTHRAVSRDDTRLHLASVEIQLKDGAFRAVATNGHWLATATRRVDVGGSISVLLPSRGAAILRAQLGKRPSGAVAFCQHLGTGYFCGEGWTVGARLVDAAFPNWQAVVPEAASAATVVTVPVGRLVEAVGAALKAAGVTPRSGDSARFAVRLTTEAGALVVESAAVRTDDVDCTARVRVEAKVSGAEAREAVNAIYLANALAPLRAEHCRLYFGAAGKLEPVAIRSRTNYTAVVMPTRV